KAMSITTKILVRSILENAHMLIQRLSSSTFIMLFAESILEWRWIVTKVLKRRNGLDVTLEEISTMLTPQFSESFNGVIREARKYTLLPIFDVIIAKWLNGLTSIGRSS